MSRILPSRRLHRVFAACLLAIACTLPAFAAGTLDKAKETGKFSIGYAQDFRPFSYADGGKASGYAIVLCNKVADAVKAQVKLDALSVDYVPLAPEQSLDALAQGRIDLLCGVVPTLTRRAQADFSIPVFLSGTAAAVRADAPARLVQVLSGREPPAQATWRASTDQAPEHAVLAVIGGTQLEKALGDRLKERRIVADVVSVADASAGLQLLAGHKVDAFFSDRALLLAATQGHAPPVKVNVLDRLFRRDLVALGVRRNDDDFRLVVDRTLSHIFRTPEIGDLYGTYFGAPAGASLEFFQLVALPD